MVAGWDWTPFPAIQYLACHFFYLVLLTPTALTHSFLLGMFGSSSEELREQAIQEEVEFQLAVEEERERRG